MLYLKSSRPKSGKTRDLSAEHTLHPNTRSSQPCGWPRIMDVQAYLTMQIADLEAQSALNLSHADKLRAELGNRDNSNRRMEKKIVRDPNKPKRAATACTSARSQHDRCFSHPHQHSPSPLIPTLIVEQTLVSPPPPPCGTHSLSLSLSLSSPDLLFGKQLRVKKAKKIKAMSPRDVMKYIGEQWKKCPAAAKVVRHRRSRRVRTHMHLPTLSLVSRGRSSLSRCHPLPPPPHAMRPHRARPQELETQASELKRKHIVDLAKYDVDARSGDAVSASTNAKQQKKKRRKNSSDC